MKYIDKINWDKVEQKSYYPSGKKAEGIIAITLTNLGDKKNVKFECHDLADGTVVPLGIWDANRIYEEAKKVNYNLPLYFAITQNEFGQPANNDNCRVPDYYLMQSAVGVIACITKKKVIRINELV